MVMIFKAKFLQNRFKPKINCNPIVKDFENFTSYTKWHGFKVIGEPKRTLLERSMWLMVVIISIVICSCFINKAYQKWQQTPIVMKIYDKQISIDEIPFPAVTICPPANFLNQTKEIKNNFSCLIDNSTAFNDTIDSNGINNTPEMNEIFAKCSWNGVAFDCEELLSKVLTEYGVCYTFNAIDRSQMFHTNITNYKDFNQATQSSCYSDFDKSCRDKYPRKGDLRDTEGLILQLKPQFPLNNPYLTNQDETKIIIHKPNELPIINNKFYGLPPSGKRILSISPRVTLTQDNLRSYLPQQRRCYFNGEKKLNYFKYYTQKNCETECLFSDTNSERDRAKRLRASSDNTKPLDFNRLEVPTESSVICDCYANCESLLYDITYLATTEDFKDDLSEVQVYFKHKDFYPYHRVPMFATMDFIVYSANYFCIFMGFSFLLVFETVYLMCVRPLTNIFMFRKEFK